MVEPVYPFQGSELDRFEAPPWSTPMDDFSLVETVDRFGEGVVVAVADASDGRLDASFCQPLGIPDRHVLDAAIRVMHEAATMSGTPIMKSLLQGIEDKASMCRPARPPSNDAASEDVDDNGHVDKTLPCGDVGEVRNPQPVWCWGFELAVNPVKRARGRLVRERRADRLSSDDPLQAHRPHKPGDTAAGDLKAFTLQLPPDLANAIDAEVLFEDTTYLDLQADIAAGADRQAIHVPTLGDVLVVGGRGDRQQSADRLDPEHTTMFVDERNYRLKGRSSSAMAK